jgi:hypothetical protein
MEGPGAPSKLGNRPENESLTALLSLAYAFVRVVRGTFFQDAD